MSVDAVSWAYKQKIKSSVKFVLVTLCDFANDEGKLWPSVATICERTCQDRKTVMSAIEELVNQGCLVDTGERKGGTKQVKVYMICQKDLSKNSTKNGTVKEYQKRNSTKNGTVPNFPIKSTKFPYKEYQISHERVPNLVHGTIIEPLDEPLDEPSDIRQVSENLPVAIPTPTEKRKTEVDVVFEHWKTVMNSPRSVLDNNRKKKIQAALKHYGVADLLKAIDGCARSAFHMGANENGMKYNSIELIFRNSEKIEQFIGFLDKPPNARKGESIEEQNARNKESIFGPIDEPYTIIQ